MGTTILLGIISIGILIFVHELGHFIAARSAGIRVEVFSIGWGRGILSFKWKDTKIQIGWIPFGGYCKLAGDSPSDDIQEKPDEVRGSFPDERIETSTLSIEPSIAVLPLVNMTGDGTQDYFVDGLTEELTEELVRYQEFRVIASQSAMRFRNRFRASTPTFSLPNISHPV